MEITTDAIPAPKRDTLCQICTSQAPKYTCPRCKFKICSLACTKAHKSGTTTQSGCSGIKEDNAGGFVAMNGYGYTAFVNDYVFLEEVGRKAADWGRDIHEKKLSTHVQARGRGGNTTRGGKSRTKREILKDVLLERADIDMQLCPEGMERRKMNQSSWDTKSNTGYLTIQYNFYRTRDQVALPLKRKRVLEGVKREDVTLLTHRNKIELPLKDSLHRAVHERSKKDGNLPAWIQELILGEKPLYVVLVRNPTVDLKGTDVGYDEVDATLPLTDALKGRTFAEFPTLEIVREKDWVTNGREWEFEPDSDEDSGPEVRRIKRIKIDEQAGKKLLGGLGYGDDGESDTEVAVEESKLIGVLDTLDYSSEASDSDHTEDLEEE